MLIFLILSLGKFRYKGCTIFSMYKPMNYLISVQIKSATVIYIFWLYHIPYNSSTPMYEMYMLCVGNVNNQWQKCHDKTPEKCTEIKSSRKKSSKIHGNRIQKKISMEKFKMSKAYLSSFLMTDALKTSTGNAMKQNCKIEHTRKESRCLGQSVYFLRSIK